MIISMAYTTPAIVVRRKCITRRHWTMRHLISYNNHLDKVHQAYSRQPQYGGIYTADIKPTAPACIGKISNDTVDNIYEQEGFAYLDDEKQTLYQLAKKWHASGELCDEIRFEIVSIDENARAKFIDPDEIAKARASLIKHLGYLK